MLRGVRRTYATGDVHVQYCQDAARVFDGLKFKQDHQALSRLSTVRG